MNDDELKKYSKKIFLENILKGILFSLFTSIIFAGVMNVILTPICNLSGFQYRNIIVLVIAIIAFAATMYTSIKIVFKTKDEQVARRVDELGLDDRVITMVQFRNDDSLIARKQREDANEKMVTIEPKMVKMKFPKFLIIVAVAGLIVGGSSFFIPEAKAKAQPEKTAYKVHFYSNGGSFSSTYLIDQGAADSIFEYQSSKPSEVVADYMEHFHEVILYTEANTSNDKFISPTLFANNETIVREGYSLVGWNYTRIDGNGMPSIYDPTTRLEITESAYYFNGVTVKGDTHFIAIWTLLDDIIKQMLEDLRNIVNNADISQELKNELLAKIDAFEDDVLHHNYTNQQKIDKTKAFYEEIMKIIEEALNKESETNKSAGEILIKHGEAIPSEALVDMGNGIIEGKIPLVNEGLDKILSETNNLDDKTDPTLANRLQQYIDALEEAALAALQDGNNQLAAALQDLANALKQAMESANKGDIEGAKDQIKDAVDKAKEEFKDALKGSDSIRDTEEKTDDTIKEALEKMEGQTGKPEDNPQEPVNPNTSGSNSGSNKNTSGSNSGSNNTSGNNSGQNTQNTSGNNSGQNTQNTSGNNSGQNTQNTSGNNSGQNTQNTSGSNSGQNTQNTSGSNSGSNKNTSGSNSNSGSNSHITSGEGHNSQDPLETTDKTYDNVIDGNTPIDQALADFFGEMGILPEQYDEYRDIIERYLEAIK